jgi:hypothetical protein
MATQPSPRAPTDRLAELAAHLRDGHVPLAWLLEHAPRGDVVGLFARSQDAGAMVYVASLGGHASRVRAALEACEARLPAREQRPKVPGGPWGRMAPHDLVTPRDRVRLAVQSLARGEADRAARQVQLVAVQAGGGRVAAVAAWLRAALAQAVVELPDVGALVEAARRGSV